MNRVLLLALVLTSAACSAIGPYKPTTQVRLPLVYTCWLEKNECHDVYEAARRLNQAVGYSALIEAQAKRYEEVGETLVFTRGIGFCGGPGGTRAVGEDRA